MTEAIVVATLTFFGVVLQSLLTARATVRVAEIEAGVKRPRPRRVLLWALPIAIGLGILVLALAVLLPTETPPSMPTLPSIVWDYDLTGNSDIHCKANGKRIGASLWGYDFTDTAINKTATRLICAGTYYELALEQHFSENTAN